MALNRTSDNLSRCDPGLYSNIYDVRKRPDVKPEVLSNPSPIHKDTIEINRDKLKEDALSRLRHSTNQTIVQNGFMRIGKMLFLAIAFPPYLLVYGLPKWVITEALPALFGMGLTLMTKIRQKTKKQADAVMRKMTRGTQFLKNVIHVLIQPVIRLVLEIRHRIERMRKSANQFLKQLTEKTKKVLHFPGEKLKAGFKRLQAKISQAREWASKQIENTSKHIQEGIQWVKQAPLLMLGWGQNQFHQLTEQTLTWKQSWSKRFQASQSKAQKATNWISQRCKQAKEGVKSLVQPLTGFYKEQLRPTWNRFKTACKGKWDRANDFFQRKHRKALAYLQAKQDKLKKLSYQELLDRLFTNALMMSLPERLQRWLKKCFYRPFVRSVLECIVKGYSLVTGFLLQVASEFMQGIAKISGVIGQSVAKVMQGVGLVLRKCLHVINSGFNYAITFILKGIYYLLLIATMTGIICTMGMRSLGRLLSNTLSKLSFKRRASVAVSVKE